MAGPDPRGSTTVPAPGDLGLRSRAAMLALVALLLLLVACIFPAAAAPRRTTPVPARLRCVACTKRASSTTSPKFQPSP